VTAAVIAPGAAADTATATQTVSCGDVPALIAAVSAADAAGSGRIELARCTYTLTAPLAQTDASGPDGLPVITGQIEIAGNGATFAANTVSEVGGAIYVEPGKQLALDDSVLTGNESAVFGGAVYLDAGATLALDTTFVSLNRAGTSGGGIFVGPGASVTSHISFVFGNTPDDCFPSGSCGLAGP
jgi:hypothetical protein